MRTGHYTRLKGRVTYFRRKVPEFLQERLASTEICYRLGVISSPVAVRLGRKLAVEVDAFFQTAKMNLMLTGADLSQLVKTALADWRTDDAYEAAADTHRPGGLLLAPDEQAQMWAELATGLISQVGDGQSAYDEPFVSDTVSKAGLKPIEDPASLSAAGRALTLGLAAHYLQSAVATAAMHGLDQGRKGLPVREWRSRLAAIETHLDLAGSITMPIAGHWANRTLPHPTDTPHPSTTQIPAGKVRQSDDVAVATVGVPFSKVVGDYLNTRIANNEVKAGIRDEMTSSLRIWLEVVGDQPITSYKRTDFLQFRSALQQVPKVYWKSAASRKLTILEVIDWARADARSAWAKSASAPQRDDAVAVARAAGNYQKVSNVTINKHLSTISPVFEWARQNEYLPEDTRPYWKGLSVATGIKVTGLKSNEERPAYSHEQILVIAGHPVWMGRQSPYFYNRPGSVIIRDSLYWSFPIALLHGMRREEFAQLRVKHVRQEDGIWVFDLHAHDISVKKGASRRYVPLHSKLLELGFLAAMIEGRNSDELLFKELSAEGELDKFGDGLGKRFARVLDHLDIEVIRKNGTESDGCYHPLRHRFITDLLKAGVREGLVDSLSGQASDARKGERVRYSEDPPVSELKEAIERLPVIVDITSWLDAWGRVKGKS